MSEPSYNMDEATSLVELVGERHLPGGGLHVYVDDLWRVYQKAKADLKAELEARLEARTGEYSLNPLAERGNR
jgi:hypothetical protein